MPEGAPIFEDDSCLREQIILPPSPRNGSFTRQRGVLRPAAQWCRADWQPSEFSSCFAWNIGLEAWARVHVQSGGPPHVQTIFLTIRPNVWHAASEYTYATDTLLWASGSSRDRMPPIERLHFTATSRPVESCPVISDQSCQHRAYDSVGLANPISQHCSRVMTSTRACSCTCNKRAACPSLFPSCPCRSCLSHPGRTGKHQNKQTRSCVAYASILCRSTGRSFTCTAL